MASLPTCGPSLFFYQIEPFEFESRSILETLLKPNLALFFRGNGPQNGPISISLTKTKPLDGQNGQA